MKKVGISLVLIFFCFKLSFAQQIINTNQKSTCTYQGIPELQNCIDENINSVFTFKENNFLFIHTVNGIDVQYTIESKTYERPYWKYRISNSEGGIFDLQANQTSKEFNFFPINIVNGDKVYKYTFN